MFGQKTLHLSTVCGLNENRLLQDIKNVINTPLINPEKVNLPSLLIKIGLIKKFRHDNKSK